MNKAIFLKSLRKQLKRLKASELEKHLSYYDEIIADMMENGLSEEEAVAKIGSPKQIAKEILENTPTENLRKEDILGKILLVTSIIMMLSATLSVIRSHIMMNAAISIIGGADGPTSVFIAGRVGTNTVLLVVTGVVVVVTIVYFLMKKLRR